MSIEYYLTGKSRNINIEFTASANIGRQEYYSPFRQFISLYSGTVLIPCINDTITFGLDQTEQTFYVQINNQNVASYSFSGIETINLTVTYLFVADEAVTVELLPTQFYDKVGKIDYPLKRRMNVVEIINDRIVQINININGNITTINRYVSFQHISNYEGYINVNQKSHMFLTPSTYNDITLECNSLANLKLNNVSYFDVSYSDSNTISGIVNQPPPQNFQYVRYGEIEVNGSKRIKTRCIGNGLLIYNPISIVSEVQSYIRAKQTKKIDLLCKVYNLDKENMEDITINIFDEDITMKHSYSRFYDNIKPYEYHYTCVGKTGSGSVSDNRYDLVKINSNYGRFLFRTFMYNAINSLSYTNTVSVGDYIDVNRYEAIKDCTIFYQNDTIVLYVHNESSGLFPMMENPSASIARYHINGDDTDYYFDSHRFLKLTISAFLSQNLNLKLKINNKEYILNITDLTSNPTDFYIDLCKPYNVTQLIDYKNNNFDEDDSYSDYWGITKSKYIDFYFNYSFVIHEIKLYDRLPNEDNTFRNKFTILGQRSTWQNSKRRVFVVRNRGKQTLELPDCMENREITLNEIIDEINTSRWNGWSAVKHVYNQCNHNGNIHNLTPCLLNLDTSASFLCGCGNMYDGQNDYNYVNVNYSNGAQYKAQYLVDEITFYPDCGDVFFDTNNNNRSGAIKLYASLIRRAQANGLVNNSNIDVIMYKYDNSHYAGNDETDFYEYYYIEGEYAKEDEYKVEPVGYGIIADKNCFDANEYRICFKIIERIKSVINDIDCYEGKIVSTTNIENTDGIMIFLHPDLANYSRLDNVYSSCDLKSGLILTAQDYLVNHSFGLRTRNFLKQLADYMFPFVITYNGEIYVTYYKQSDKNFVFEKYDANFNLLYRYYNIITTVPANSEIPEQNFPITITEGMILGVFVYQVSDNKYLQFVSSVNGKKWIKQKEISI